MHVHAEGRDESEAKVVAERPGVGVGAKVPADQRAVDGGVRQHGLGARVKMVDVDRAAVLLQVQTPERRTQTAVGKCSVGTRHQNSPAAVGLTWSGMAALWEIWVVCWPRPPEAGWTRCLRPRLSNASPDRRSASSRDRQYESKSALTCGSTARNSTAPLEWESSHPADGGGDQRVLTGSPGGRRLSFHLLTVPHFDGAVIGRRSEDGVLVGDPDAVHGSFVFMEVSDQQPFRVPP